MTMDLSILFEDNHIIVCVKPAGIQSQGSDLDLPNMVDLLKDYIKEKYAKPGNVYLGLVHRLDLNVGGVMIFAKTSKAARRLSEQVRSDDFGKRYLAIAKGTYVNKEGSLEDYIAKDEKLKTAKIAPSNSGQYSLLHYQVLGESDLEGSTYSLVDVKLITGRFHQIRFQFAHHGHPLLGDKKYGGHGVDDYFLGLFAYQLEFIHPVTRETMRFQTKPTDKRFTSFVDLDRIDRRTI
ncbi:MAG: RluA family pseudouridine synthase [Bacilli bacterium]|nr:RluA family pseudouridine synthase [Bacilli bacterium]MBN2876533.1 RluA family pseudouridine synthase [Bacilli bacterium]